MRPERVELELTSRLAYVFGKAFTIKAYEDLVEPEGGDRQCTEMGLGEYSLDNEHVLCHEVFLISEPLLELVHLPNPTRTVYRSVEDVCTFVSLDRTTLFKDFKAYQVSASWRAWDEAWMFLYQRLGKDVTKHLFTFLSWSRDDAEIKVEDTLTQDERDLLEKGKTRLYSSSSWANR